jgi:hypothetical protein
VTFSSQQTQTINADGFSIALPASVYIDSSGNAFEGDVTAEVAFLDVTTDKERNAFPGLYEGKSMGG